LTLTQSSFAATGVREAEREGNHTLHLPRWGGRISAIEVRCFRGTLIIQANRPLDIRKSGMIRKQLTAIIEREGSGYVSLCPELDIASQGDSIEEARKNLQEALELFFETASPSEIQSRFHEEVYVTRLEIAVG